MRIILVRWGHLGRCRGTLGGEKLLSAFSFFGGGFEFHVYLLYLLLLRVVLGVLAQVVLERKYYRLVEMVAWCS